MFDFSELISDYGEPDRVVLWILHPHEASATSRDLEVVDGVAPWVITAVDTGVPGSGEFQLDYHVGQKLAKALYPFVVHDDIDR